MDVGGYRLHVEIGGIGSPAVVLDAGLGGGVATWSEVLPAVAEKTTAVAFDRAGLGGSDPGPLPRTSSRMVEEMHAMLRAAEVPPPYVLVGHAFGGANVRLYAHRYPDEVAAIVLVDATHEDFPSREARLRSAGEWRRLETSLLLSREAVQLEYAVMAQSMDEVRSALELPRVPIYVLSAGGFEGSPGVRALWLDFQADLAGRFPGAAQTIVPRSGHMMPFDAPEAVVAAIRSAVDAARGVRRIVSGAGPSPPPDRP